MSTPDKESVSDLAEELRRSVSFFVRNTRARADVLTRSRAEALDQLDRAGPQTIRQLADHLAVRHQAMSRTVLELEEHGLVTRTQSTTDARASIIEVSAAGQRALHHDQQARRDVIGDAIATRLDADELASVRMMPALLRKLAE